MHLTFSIISKKKQKAGGSRSAAQTSAAKQKMAAKQRLFNQPRLKETNHEKRIQNILEMRVVIKHLFSHFETCCVW
ncbi:MAG: hypothetical protein AB1813_09425 [Verrucomicrobiota bacterium]